MVVNQAQIDIAKTMWEQTRAAARQAYEAWGMVMNSQKVMLDSMRSSGAPFALAADQFEKLQAFQAQQYQAALEQMDKMQAEYVQLLSSQQKG